MNLYSRAALFIAVAFVALYLVPAIFGDEGMWLFNNPPRKQLKDKYNFEITTPWLEHVQKASVRFNVGGSGSFVSADGLVMTNHHVGADELEKISTKEHNYLAEGFYAAKEANEHKCEGMELNVLMSIEDVTAKVNAAVKPDMKPAEAAEARRKIMSEIEKASLDATGLRSDVITLYQGGQYHLYRYKKYTDVRLVFAPEQQAAFFGGDPDNFEYPRYDFDICMFRVYEDNKPAKIEHYLKWSKSGAKDDELVFVPGNPGRTDRQATVEELKYLRDIGYPFRLQQLYRMEVFLTAFGQRSAENDRISHEDLLSVQNSRKAYDGEIDGLLDPQLFAHKIEEQAKLKAAVEKDSKLSYAKGAWDRIAAAQKTRAAHIHPYTVLEGGRGLNSQLFGIARTLLRHAEEKGKPAGEQLREYRPSNLESLKQQLFDPAPIYPEYEKVKLAHSLTFLAAQLGADDPLVKKVLNGKPPSERAAELINNSSLADVAKRKELFDADAKTVQANGDAMIQLARLVDPESRQVRKTMENEVEEVQRQAYAEIAKVRFALEGTSTYPDATFTLRLAYGVVKGYEEGGKHIPFETTFAGLYERSKENHDKPPFNLPERWVKNKDKLDLKTPFNFVCTADIIGGNSGSPVINRDAEVVGLIFDGNIQSLVLDFAFTETQARAVSVHSRGIIEGLRKIYGANELADEMTTGKRK